MNVLAAAIIANLHEGPAIARSMQQIVTLLQSANSTSPTPIPEEKLAHTVDLVMRMSQTADHQKTN
jgi:hypothetical protein